MNVRSGNGISLVDGLVIPSVCDYSIIIIIIIIFMPQVTSSVCELIVASFTGGWCWWQAQADGCTDLAVCGRMHFANTGLYVPHTIYSVLCAYCSQMILMMILMIFISPFEVLFQKLNWLPISQRREYNKSVLVFQSLDGSMRHYMSTLFYCILQYEILKLEVIYLIPQVKTELYRTSLAYSGA